MLKNAKTDKYQKLIFIIIIFIQYFKTSLFRYFTKLTVLDYATCICTSILPYSLHHLDMPTSMKLWKCLEQPKKLRGTIR